MGKAGAVAFGVFGVQRSAFSRSAFGGAVRGSAGVQAFCCFELADFNTFNFYVMVIPLWMTLLNSMRLSDAESLRVRRLASICSRGAVFSRDPVLTTALRKTLLSVYSNFGEGFERDGNREFAQFVSIAKGSLGETRAQLIYALDFGYFETRNIFEELDDLAQTATACLGGLIRYLNNSSFRGRKFRRQENLSNDPKPIKTPNPAPAERQRAPNWMLNAER